MRTVELTRHLKKELISALDDNFGFAPIQKDIILIGYDSERISGAIGKWVYVHERQKREIARYTLETYFTAVYNTQLENINRTLPTEIDNWRDATAWLGREMNLRAQLETESDNQNSLTH